MCSPPNSFAISSKILKLVTTLSFWLLASTEITLKVKKVRIKKILALFMTSYEFLRCLFARFALRAPPFAPIKIDNMQSTPIDIIIAGPDGKSK